MDLPVAMLPVRPMRSMVVVERKVRGMRVLWGWYGDVLWRV